MSKLNKITLETQCFLLVDLHEVVCDTVGGLCKQLGNALRLSQWVQEKGLVNLNPGWTSLSELVWANSSRKRQYDLGPYCSCCHNDHKRSPYLLLFESTSKQEDVLPKTAEQLLFSSCVVTRHIG